MTLGEFKLMYIDFKSPPFGIGWGLREFHSAVVQIFFALEELSKQKIMHGDMHFDNILFPKYNDMCLNAKHAGVSDDECQHLYMDKMSGSLIIGTNSPEDAFKIERIVKIFDWDKMELLKDRDPWLYHDKIGFLRRLVAMNYPGIPKKSPEKKPEFPQFPKKNLKLSTLYNMELKLWKTWETVKAIIKNTTFKENGRTFLQISDMEKLTNTDKINLPNVDKVIESVKKYALGKAAATKAAAAAEAATKAAAKRT